MTTEQDLVVTEDEVLAAAKGEKNTYNPYSGGGAAENVYSTVQSIQNGDWDTAGLSAMSSGIDLVGLAMDPLGSLASWGVGFLIEHVWFLREPFDALMGDPNEISAMSGTWENVAKEIRQVGAEYRNATSNTTEWEGKAAEAYRDLGKEIADSIDALSAASAGVKSGVDGAGTVVGAVRGIVRDLIAGAIGEIAAAALRWLVASVATAGIAIGGAIADAVRLALKWADKISGWMRKLGEVLHNLWSKLDNLGSAAASIRTSVDDFFRLLSNPPQASIMNVQGQKALTEQNVTDAAQHTAPSTTTGSMARRGFLAGGAEYKPWAQGDIFTPNLQFGEDYGRTKLATDTVKEAAKLDDGAGVPSEQQEGHQQ